MEDDYSERHWLSLAYLLVALRISNTPINNWENYYHRVTMNILLREMMSKD